MPVPKLFIGSASESREIVDALESELRSEVHIERWDLDVFNPGRFTLEELTAATAKVDFAVFVLGQDDKTQSRGNQAVPSPRDNVIFEAGLFTAVLGRERTYYIVDKLGTKIPSDWAGLGYLTFDGTAARPRDKVYDAVKQIRSRVQQLGDASHSRPEARIAGCWWQLVENLDEGAVVSLMEITPSGAIVRVEGQSWDKDGKWIAEYLSLTGTFDAGDNTLHYYWKGRHPRDKSVPEFFGVGEIIFAPRAGEATRGSGFYTATSVSDSFHTSKKSAFYIRAKHEEVEVIRNGSRDARKALVDAMLKERQGRGL